MKRRCIQKAFWREIREQHKKAKQTEECRKRVSSAADVSDGFGMDGVKRPDQRRNKRSAIIEIQLAPERKHQACIGRMQGDIQNMKTERPRPGELIDKKIKQHLHRAVKTALDMRARDCRAG